MLHTIGVYFVAVGILSNIYAFFFGGYNVPADKHACQIAYWSKTCIYCNWDKLPCQQYSLQSYTHRTNLNENTLEECIQTPSNTQRFMKQFYTTQSSFSLLFTKYGTEVTGVIPGPLSFFSTPVVICLRVSAWERVSGMIQMYQHFSICQRVLSCCTVSSDRVCFVNPLNNAIKLLS